MLLLGDAHRSLCTDATDFIIFLVHFPRIARGTLPLQLFHFLTRIMTEGDVGKMPTEFLIQTGWCTSFHESCADNVSGRRYSIRCNDM